MLTIGLVAPLTTHASERPAKPNVLLLLADDLGWVISSSTSHIADIWALASLGESLCAAKLWANVF